MSANMFALLSDEPIVAAEPKPVVAAQKQSKPASSAASSSVPVGGVKKGQDAPRNEGQRKPQGSTGTLPGEVRKEQRGPRGPRRNNQQQGDDQQKPRGREFDRHVSGTGRLANEQKRQGAGRRNWGANKDAAADVAAVEAELATTTVEGEAAPAVAPVEGEVAVDAKKEEFKKEPEVKFGSLSQHQAEQAKKQRELDEKLGFVVPETRKVEASWYKPKEAEKPKQAAPAAKKTTTKSETTTKKFVDLSGPVNGQKRYGNEHHNKGPRKQPKTFDATANQEKNFPALGKK